MNVYSLLICAAAISSSFTVSAEKLPTYHPAKVVYDLSSADTMHLQNVLDRVSMLQNIYQNNSFEASIVVVIHEDAIPLFTRNKETNKYRKISGKEKVQQLMIRARSLVLGEVIQFRVCRASAKMQGLNDHDLHEFINMIPMADAEIIRLQNQGFAYLRI